MNGYKLARLAAIERDGGHCRLCGTSERLTVHHAIPRFIVRHHRPENLVCLCRGCHDVIEELDQLALYLSWAPYLTKERLS